MPTREDIYNAIRNADKAGDSEAVRKLGAYLQTMPAEEAQTPAPAPDTRNRGQEMFEGALRGAASIGNTLLTPVRAAANALAPEETSVTSLVTGKKQRTGVLAPVANYLNRMVSDANSLDAENADSNYYKGAKIGTQIAMTLPVGGAAAQAVRTVAPGFAATGIMPNLLRAVETSGASGGNLLTRSAGGAISGGLSAGLVNPDEAGSGAVLGAITPGVLSLAGQAGSALANKLRVAPGDPQKLAAAAEAAKAGYVIPPSDIRPQGAAMEALGGLSGKVKTAQEASSRNQGITNDLAKKALGIAPDQPLTRDALDTIRANAGKAYDAVASSGLVQPGPAYEAALDKIAAPFQKASQGFPGAKPNPIISEIDGLRSQSFDAGSAVEKIKELREAADKAYATRDKSAGKALKSAAGALEDALDEHLQKIGAPSDLLDAYRSARQTIAKSYTVQNALNNGTGDVSAPALANQLKRGKPLSGELGTIANAGEAFPKATQALKEAPKAVSPLDWAFAAGRGNLLDLASLGVRPLARSVVLSGPVQRAALQQPSNALIDLLQSGASSASPLVYRAAPQIANAR